MTDYSMDAIKERKRAQGDILASDVMAAQPKPTENGNQASALFEVGDLVRAVIDGVEQTEFLPITYVEHGDEGYFYRLDDPTTATYYPECQIEEQRPASEAVEPGAQELDMSISPDNVISAIMSMCYALDDETPKYPIERHIADIQGYFEDLSTSDREQVIIRARVDLADEQNGARTCQLLSIDPPSLAGDETSALTDSVLVDMITSISENGHNSDQIATLFDVLALKTQTEQIQWRKVLEDSLGITSSEFIGALVEARKRQRTGEGEPVSIDDDGPIMPDLPDFAKLTPEQEKEAAMACVWLDHFEDFMSKASPLTPKTFFTAAGLFVGSMAIARRLYVPVSVEDNWIYPNVYMFFVGHSTLPRKTTATKVARGYIRETGLSHMLHQPRQTPEAFISEMSVGQMSRHFDTWTPEQQKEYLDERPYAAQRSWLLEEASFLLSSFNRDYSSGLLPMVLDLYECQQEGTLSANTQTRGREQVKNAYLSIFGSTTYGAIARHALEPMHWENGLFARFALVGSDGSGEWSFWPDAVDYPEWLIKRLQWVANDLLPAPGPASIEEMEVGDGDKTRIVKVINTDDLDARPVKITPGAWAHWEKYCKATSWDMLKSDLGFVPPKYFANYGRFGTMLIKVATILAAFDTDDFDENDAPYSEAARVTIDTRHVYRAQQIVETWRASLHKLMKEVVDAVSGDEQDAIYQALAKSGNDWVTRRELLRTLNKKWRDIELDIRDMLESGRIEEQDHKPKRGRMSKKYRAI